MLSAALALPVTWHHGSCSGCHARQCSPAGAFFTRQRSILSSPRLVEMRRAPESKGPPVHDTGGPVSVYCDRVTATGLLPRGHYGRQGHHKVIIPANQASCYLATIIPLATPVCPVSSLRASRQSTGRASGHPPARHSAGWRLRSPGQALDCPAGSSWHFTAPGQYADRYRKSMPPIYRRCRQQHQGREAHPSWKCPRHT